MLRQVWPDDTVYFIDNVEDDVVEPDSDVEQGSE